MFLRLGEMPLVDALPTEEDLDRPEGRHPLDVALCRRCALAQIVETVPPEALFVDDYHYYSSYSETLLEASRRLAERLVASLGLDGSSLVVEVASNDGYLLQYFRDRGVPVLGIDPSPGPARAARANGIPTLKAFFGRDLARGLRAEGKTADLVVANNVLAHVPDLDGFVEGLRLLLKEDGTIVAEVGYLGDLVDRCAFDTIYHEHHCYFSVTALDTLFRRHGLYLHDLERIPAQGGSLRLHVGKTERDSAAVREHLAREREEGLTRPEYFEGFAARVEAVRDRLVSLVERLRAEGARIAAYGAAAKGSAMLNYAGLGPDRIEFVVDRNPHKQGRYVPGVRIPIRDPAEILRESPDYLLILPWNLLDEIAGQQAAYRERGGRFIVPVPWPTVL